MAGKEEPVSHILNEISRVTKVLIGNGATITAQLVRNHYRRLPLFQGGSDISCKLTATIPGTVSNLLCMEIYWEIITNLCIESKNE